MRKITAMEKVDKEDPRDAVLKYAKVKRTVADIVHFYTCTNACTQKPLTTTSTQ